MEKMTVTLFREYETTGLKRELEYIGRVDAESSTELITILRTIDEINICAKMKVYYYVKRNKEI